MFYDGGGGGGGAAGRLIRSVANTKCGLVISSLKMGGRAY